MIKTIDVIQNSPEWKAQRRGRLGSSTSPVVMGASKFQTPYELWRIMTGRAPEPDFSNFATQKGHEVEPIARATYALDRGVDVQKDVVLIHESFPWAIVSLDGFMQFVSEDGRITFGVLEIKCVRDEIFQLAKAGRVHEEYVWQLEKQLLISGAEWADFMCVKADKDQYGKWVIKEYHIVRYVSDPDRRVRLIEAETAFMQMVATDTPPPLSDDDVLLRTEPEAVAVYAEMKRLKDEIDALSAKSKEFETLLEPLKEKAISMMKHSKESAEGLVLTKQVKTSIDNAAVVSAIGSTIDTAPFTKTKETYVLRRA